MIAILQAGYRFDIDDFKQAILSLAVMVNFPSLTPNPVHPAFPSQPEVSVPFSLRCGQPIPPCFKPSRLNPEPPVFRPASMETSDTITQSQLIHDKELMEAAEIVGQPSKENDTSEVDEETKEKEKEIMDALDAILPDSILHEMIAKMCREDKEEEDKRIEEGEREREDNTPDSKVVEREETKEEALDRALDALEIVLPGGVVLPVWGEEEEREGEADTLTNALDRRLDEVEQRFEYILEIIVFKYFLSNQKLDVKSSPNFQSP
jgi:hypothetical protein